ncbi:zinc finger BED domain-containing protein 5-like [Sipha flava]|uniref:Zinc finger BED domain-containing protein 5-like n=1 Tax=Sipha flava TaxID=143950 RepID=A0A8B8FVT1_9HEMI|nr:zinc finger BED domain-containing protein 5-like [Sipha flava]
MSDKVNAFIKKLGIWIIRLEKRNFDAFDLTSNYIEKNVNLKSPILDRVFDTMKTYLRKVKIKLLEYFSCNDNDFSNRWVLNPFDENIVAVAKLPVETHNQLIELSADKKLQLQFGFQDLNKVWIARKNEYGSLVSEALKILIPFATSYLCEKGFSSMVAI